MNILNYLRTHKIFSGILLIIAVLTTIPAIWVSFSLINAADGFQQSLLFAHTLAALTIFLYAYIGLLRSEKKKEWFFTGFHVILVIGGYWFSAQGALYLTQSTYPEFNFLIFLVSCIIVTIQAIINRYRNMIRTGIILTCITALCFGALSIQNVGDLISFSDIRFLQVFSLIPMLSMLLVFFDAIHQYVIFEGKETR